MAKGVHRRRFIPVAVAVTPTTATKAVAVASSPAAFVANGGNTGAGTVTGVAGKLGAPAETITLTCLTGGATGTFSVVGSVSGALGTATVGTPFTSSVINLTINDGTPDFIIGDSFTSAVTASTPAGTQQFVATFTTANGLSIAGHHGTWSSSNTAKATISSSGLATAVASGTSNINYTFAGGTGTLTDPSPAVITVS